MSDTVTVRQATGADAAAVAGVMCRALQAAYLGVEHVAGAGPLGGSQIARGTQLPRGSDVPADRRRLAVLTPDDLVDGARAALEADDPSDRTLVAVVDAEVVGFHRLRLDADHTTRPAASTGEVASLYVDPAAWQAGSGARLLEEGLDRLARHGCRQAWLWVADENDRAKRFYRRRGFVPDGTTESQRLQPWGVDLGFDLTVVRLVCDLPPSDPEAHGDASAGHDAGIHDDPPPAELGPVGSAGSSKRPST